MAFKIDLYVLLLAEVAAQALHGGGDSQIFQSCGVQFMRQRLGIGSYLGGMFSQFFQAVPDFSRQIVAFMWSWFSSMVNNARR